MASLCNHLEGHMLVRLHAADLPRHSHGVGWQVLLPILVHHRHEGDHLYSTHTSPCHSRTASLDSGHAHMETHRHSRQRSPQSEVYSRD